MTSFVPKNQQNHVLDGITLLQEWDEEAGQVTGRAALEQNHHRCKFKMKTLQYELLRCTLQMNCILFCNTC